MNTETIPKPVPPPLIRSWNTLNQDLLRLTGPISVRTDLGVEHIGKTAVCPASDNVELDAKSSAIFDDILKSGQEFDLFSDADSITVMQSCIIATATENGGDIDIELHRRTESAGPIVEVLDCLGDMETAPTSLLDIIAMPRDLVERDGPCVFLHDDNNAPIKLDYAGSFDIQTVSDSRLPEWITEKLSTEPGEVITCDLHQGNHGLKSLTITRDEITDEGEFRQIIFNEIA